jgi:hypothetical protein
MVRSAQRARLEPCGLQGATLRHAHSLPRRGSRPGFADLSPRREGDGAPQSAKPDGVAFLEGTRGRLAARHTRYSLGHRAALSPRVAKLRSSASSWQGLGSGPGRSPGAARVPGLRTRPAGAAPADTRNYPMPATRRVGIKSPTRRVRPASRRLARTPLQRTRWEQHRCASARGDKSATRFAHRRAAG